MHAGVITQLTWLGWSLHLPWKRTGTVHDSILQRSPLSGSDKLKDDYSLQLDIGIMIKLMFAQNCVQWRSVIDLITCGQSQIDIHTNNSRKVQSFKNVMTLSLADFYSVLSSKIFKAEMKEFKVTLCWPEHVKVAHRSISLINCILCLYQIFVHVR